MFLVGLSGGIASGKSTVVAVLRELGCAVIDADVIAREVVQPHFKAYQQIVSSFGTEILLENGEINREALGNIIFSQPEKRQLLNSITHPEIQKEMLKQILKYFVLGYRYVILDIPLLFETNRLTKFMKYTVLVYCFFPTSCASGIEQLLLHGCSSWRGQSSPKSPSTVEVLQRSPRPTPLLKQGTHSSLPRSTVAAAAGSSPQKETSEPLWAACFRPPAPSKSKSISWVPVCAFPWASPTRVASASCFPPFCSC
ncbi:dephospho-CoA kinase domain-containing protein isoform X1 [Pogoniulus pusillus]|uniref:dephospho-CoA kinase domain-containing protein isoform X1 n=1 Tax=Pogoniulus pusillus TaxID=488313 RepID=UPI0030B92FA4